MGLYAFVCGLAVIALHGAPGLGVRPEGPSPPRVSPGLELERGTAIGPKLEPIGGGRLRHRDTKFTAIIQPDGSVEFRDPLGESTLEVIGFDLRRRKFKQYP